MTESISQEMMFKYSLPGLKEEETEKQDIRSRSSVGDEHFYFHF